MFKGNGFKISLISNWLIGIHPYIRNLWCAIDVCAIWTCGFLCRRAVHVTDHIGFRHPLLILRPWWSMSMMTNHMWRGISKDETTMSMHRMYLGFCKCLWSISKHECHWLKSKNAYWFFWPWTVILHLTLGLFTFCVLKFWSPPSLYIFIS